MTRPPHTASLKKSTRTDTRAGALVGENHGLAATLEPSQSPTARIRGVGPQEQQAPRQPQRAGCRCRRARQPAAPSPRLGSRSHGGRPSGNLRLPQGSADCDDLYRARASFPCLVPSFSSCDASVASASHVASGPSRYHSGSAKLHAVPTKVAITGICRICNNGHVVYKL